MSHKYVYMFEEGNANMRELLGGKGANLAEMTNLGMPVPYGFTISTEACTRYYDDNEKIADEIVDEIFTYLKKLENKAGKVLGDKNNPLLVSVRSGARASMPGMMDTILNLGVLREILSHFFLVVSFESDNQILHIISIQFDVLLDTLESFDFINDDFECALR